jgi:hypothetical protein
MKDPASSRKRGRRVASVLLLREEGRRPGHDRPLPLRGEGGVGGR